MGDKEYQGRIGRSLFFLYDVQGIRLCLCKDLKETNNRAMQVSGRRVLGTKGMASAKAQRHSGG